MYTREWNTDELRGLASGSFLRMFAQAEEVGREGAAPAQDLYEKPERVDVAWKYWA
jgi:hypothetical protein